MTTLPQTTIRLPRPPSNGSVVNPPVVGTMPHAPASSSMTAADVWRVIRANLWLILAFLCASLILGYVVNSLLERYFSRYTASGMISIQAPTSYNISTHTYETLGEFPGLQVEQRTQAMLIHNDSLFTRVLQNPSSPIRNTAWFHSFEVPVKQSDGLTRAVLDTARAKKSLDDNFSATPLDGTNVVAVGMTYANPRDARDIVEAIVDQHLEIQDQLITEREFEKSQALTQALDAVNAKVKDLQDKLHAKALDLNIEGAGNSDKLATRQDELQKLVGERFELQSRLTTAKANLDSLMNQINRGENPESIETQVNQDPQIQSLQGKILDIDVQIKSMYQTGTDSPEYKRLQATRDVLAGELQDARSNLRITIRNSMISQLQSTQTLMSEQLGDVSKRVDSARDELSALANTMGDYNNLSDQLLKSRDEQSQLQQQLEALNVQIQQTSHGVMWAEKPIIPDSRSFPRLPITMAVSIMAGLALGLGIAFLRELMDNSVRSPRDISRVGNLNLLGMIPHEDDDPQSHGVALPFVIYQAPTSIMAEGFRQVRTRLQHAASLDTTRTILVTSPSPGDGKSVVAANLAAGLALNGRRILLVDANFRRPTLDKSFSVDNSTGLGDVLGRGMDQFDGAVHRTAVPGLDVMPTGARPANATELLEGRTLLEFIDRALEEYDHIIFDSGPMLLVSETAALAPRVDGVVTVVRARSNSRGLLQRLRDNLRQLKAEHLGVVLNAVRSQGGGYYGRNIKTYYEYQNVD